MGDLLGTDICLRFVERFGFAPVRIGYAPITIRQRILRKLRDCYG